MFGAKEFEGCIARWLDTSQLCGVFKRFKRNMSFAISTSFLIFSCLTYDVCFWCAIALQNTKLESELLTIRILEYMQPK